MISLFYNLATDTCTLSGTTAIKRGGDVGITLVFTASPGTVSALELYLTDDTSSKHTLAYTGTFTPTNATTYTATLDASDTRLATFLSGKASAALNIEVRATLDGELRVCPDVKLTVQQTGAGDPTTSSGPTYYTAPETDAAIATAIAGVSFTVATQSEAIGFAENTHAMTSLRTGQAIAAAKGRTQTLRASDTLTLDGATDITVGLQALLDSAPNFASTTIYLNGRGVTSDTLYISSNTRLVAPAFQTLSTATDTPTEGSDYIFTGLIFGHPWLVGINVTATSNNGDVALGAVTATGDTSCTVNVTTFTPGGSDPITDWTLTSTDSFVTGVTLAPFSNCHLIMNKHPLGDARVDENIEIVGGYWDQHALKQSYTVKQGGTPSKGVLTLTDTLTTGLFAISTRPSISEGDTVELVISGGEPDGTDHPICFIKSDSSEAELIAAIGDAVNTGTGVAAGAAGSFTGTSAGFTRFDAGTSKFYTRAVGPYMAAGPVYPQCAISGTGCGLTLTETDPATGSLYSSVFGIFLSGVRGVKLEGVTCANAKCFAFLLMNVADVTGDVNCYWVEDLASGSKDGMHINGPAERIRLKVTHNGNDDAFSLATDEGVCVRRQSPDAAFLTAFPSSGGAMHDIVIEPICNGSHLWRFNGAGRAKHGDDAFISDVEIVNARGAIASISGLGAFGVFDTPDVVKGRVRINGYNVTGANTGTLTLYNTQVLEMNGVRPGVVTALTSVTETAGNYFDRVSVVAKSSNFTVSIPAGFRLNSVVVKNNTANAITGGLKIGTSSGATDVLAATAVAGSALVDVGTLKNTFSLSATQTLYVQAVSAWNSANVDMYFNLARLGI